MAPTDRKSNIPGRQYGDTPSRLASLETTTDVIRSDVEGISNTLDHVQEELGDLKTSQSVQTHKLTAIEGQVSGVQSSVAGMESKILSSVHNLLHIAKNTEALDKSLAEDSKLFSKERMAGYSKAGGVVAGVIMFIYGIIKYLGTLGGDVFK